MFIAFYLCVSMGSAIEVSYNHKELSGGVSSLPNDCIWTDNLDNPQREIVKTINEDQIEVDGLLIDISKVKLKNGWVGYSSGYSPRIG